MDTAVVAAANQAEAELAPGVRVIAADSPSDVVTWLRGGRPPRPGTPPPVEPGPPHQPSPLRDLAEVLGQSQARMAAEVCAAGGHNLSLLGPPGAGKTMLAERIPTILPRLEPAAALEVASRFWAIIDEAALRRLVGGRDIMRDQITRLQEMRQQANVTIQVIPFRAGAHPGMDGSFVILNFPDADDPSIVYIESAAGGLFLEEDIEIRRYILMFEHLRAAALGLDATAELLAAIAAEL